MPSSISLTFCKKNLELYSQSVYDALRANYPDLEIEVKDCLDMCAMCTDVPFALRNGALIGGRDPMGLYRKLERGMQFLSAPPLPGTSGYREQIEEHSPVVSTGKESSK
ncbi:DUF1450 domain-containing protein [Sulfoacidibacillus thermotolerans]|uniref:DUF1450 domain-containing protein n=1 Tax=Sulfoacidibacillus thermotolerans TaxID=1765684 RepID=A0A2U3DCN4_SULT2|nr:DUF1450 domain-containing protein [Sulfoacidibacillus thermotolerans]PWI59044.1 hypothetical protein BM613_00050 [Sulfoacidibacillus thermotolerans]